jgi:hypothetical protein
MLKLDNNDGKALNEVLMGQKLDPLHLQNGVMQLLHIQGIRPVSHSWFAI